MSWTMPWPRSRQGRRRLCEIGFRHCLGTGRDRLDDIVIAGAAAEITFELLADRLFGEVMALAVNHVDGRHDHAWGAEAALQTWTSAERFLERVQRRATTRKPLDGPALVTVGHDRQRGARLHRLAVEMHDAGAALRGIAANMRAGQSQILAQELHQESARV